MSTAFKYKFFFFILFSVNNAFALSTEGLFLFRSNDAFDSTMYRLKNNLQKNGYDYVKVQSVDKGLKSNGYETDYYRTVFFAKKDKMAKLVNKHPELIPYLPLKITIYSEEDNTMLVGLNPRYLFEAYPNKKVRHFLEIWSKDIHNILEETSKSE
jgi:uncharacterized protein (DUF302 family)